MIQPLLVIFALVVAVTSAASTAYNTCGGTFTSTSGVLTSTNYPNHYGNNLVCEWVIQTGAPISLTFTDFEVEGSYMSSNYCPYDSVKLYNGNSLINEYCGNLSPFTITASSGTMRIVFTTDGSITHKGFYATWGDVPQTTPAATTTPGSTGCGGTFPQIPGEITSPNFPSNYGNNLNCVYNIPGDGNLMYMAFPSFNVETASGCTYDYVAIYETSGTNAVLLGKFCGTSVSSVEGRSFRVVFSTDSSVVATGFRATFQHVTCASKGGTCQSSCGAGDEINKEFPCDSGVCCFKPVLPDDVCGKVSSSRIVGGSETKEHTWPWQVSLQTSSNFHFCGGSLISDQWVITAAHCVDGGVAKVVLGEHDRRTSSGRELALSVSKIIPHESYSSGAPYPNDIALLKLNQKVTFSSSMSPACIPKTDTEFDTNTDECWISGWGDTKGTGNENLLNELKVNLTPRSSCRNMWSANYILDTHICVGNGDIGACNGDSGGPLSCRQPTDPRWFLAGATSWGYSGCQQAGYPNVYTRVSQYRSWIETHIRQDR
ncbi:hypothetical protein CHS0354_034964 [Potamilus streckersoni]|uniref:Uncharacterized protein n=1 Tax=Potamilus streckersoni TaxID=2493646 RepID=A0AAE0SDA3_9BIVA|nr:hypothetical protein CHS0354_034964 [Potamilus streckersoni]